MSQIYSSDTQIDNPVTVAGGVIDASGSTVSVTNFPATQPVSGSVSVSNLPATQPVSGTVSVGNFPATQPVSGTVSVGNFPATQPVSGTVSVGNVVSVITANASSATLTVVSQSNTTDTSLLATNINRKSAIIFLPKSGTSVAYDTTASATHFTYKTGAANTTIIVTGYTGAIHSFGMADTINVTELV